jgi:hypothetical protein
MQLWEDRTLSGGKFQKTSQDSINLTATNQTITTQLPSVKTPCSLPIMNVLITLTMRAKSKLWKDSEKPEDLLEDFQVNIKVWHLVPMAISWQLAKQRRCLGVERFHTAHKPVRLCKRNKEVSMLSVHFGRKLATVSEDVLSSYGKLQAIGDPIAQSNSHSRNKYQGK